MSQKQSRASQVCTFRLNSAMAQFFFLIPSFSIRLICHELIFLNLVLAFSIYQCDKFTPFALLYLLKVFPLKLWAMYWTVTPVTNKHFHQRSISDPTLPNWLLSCCLTCSPVTSTLDTGRTTTTARPPFTTANLFLSMENSLEARLGSLKFIPKVLLHSKQVLTVMSLPVFLLDLL